MRYQVDAIVHADGQVEEGIPGTYGRGGFALPATVTITEPAAVLSTLHEAGARTVLLHGGPDLAARFLDLRLVHEARVFRATTSASPIRAALGLHCPASGVIVTVAVSLSSVVEHGSAPLPDQYRWLLCGAVERRLAPNQDAV